MAREMAVDTIERKGKLFCRKCFGGGVCDGLTHRGERYEGFGAPRCVECGRELTRAVL
jgi:hypothetical protein